MKATLNRTQLKYLAVIAMIVDHVGVFLLGAYAPGAGAAAGAAGIAGGGIAGLTALYVVCRIIGRLTAPLMCFFLAEGFTKTYSPLKYVIRLGVFAVISQAPYVLAHHGTVILGAGGPGAVLAEIAFNTDINMIATLLIAFIALLAFKYLEDSPLRWVAIIVLMLASIPCDWGVFAPLFVLCFYIYRANRRKQLRSFAIISAILIGANIGYLAAHGTPWYAELWQLGMFAFIPLIGLYDGKLGIAKAPKPATPAREGATPWIFGPNVETKNTEEVAAAQVAAQASEEVAAAQASEEMAAAQTAAAEVPAGTPGPLSAFAGKWFFYIIYPAHLLVFFLIRLGLGTL